MLVAVEIEKWEEKKVKNTKETDQLELTDSLVPVRDGTIMKLGLVH